jgi:hypothetical protein
MMGISEIIVTIRLDPCCFPIPLAFDIIEVIPFEVIITKP